MTYKAINVPGTGFEPAHPCERCDLNTVRLPISPPGRDSEFWILDSGFWILDSGFWILDSGFWILDSGFWHQGCKYRKLSC